MTIPALPPWGNPALAWLALTTRVAWCLYRSRIRVTASILAEVRDHVLLSLPSLSSCPDLEDATDLLVEEYLERTRSGRIPGPREPPPLPAVDPTWRRAVEASCDATVLAVFRHRYGDGAPPAVVMRACGLDSPTLQAVLDGLREVVREEARSRGVTPIPPGTAWTDALLERVAASAGDDCPPGAELADLASRPGSPAHPVAKHVGDCPRCARAVRLVRAGLIAPTDLVPPDGFPWPPSQAALLALHLHPQGRTHLRSLAAALGSSARMVGEDSILVDLGQGDDWRGVLLQRIRMGLPSRDHVRGAVARGPGRWTPRTVIGPVPLEALEASRARTWGEVEGIPLLPDPLPRPPSVAHLWTGAILVGLLAALAGAWLLLGRAPPARWPIDADVQVAEGAVRVRFDVDDRAIVDVYDLEPREARRRLGSASAADKADLATGDGDYEATSSGNGLVVISSEEPLPDLGDVLGGLGYLPVDPSSVQDRVRAIRPDADVIVALRPAQP
ncbi:MAG: hypothetical protein JXB39_00910 [Deltaproteobacteria bacterium]|nr:hypothetical protein [Deltaproteobacteria bacterium]